jgi:hypothetical protein
MSSYDPVYPRQFVLFDAVKARQGSFRGLVGAERQQVKYDAVTRERPPFNSP